MVDAVGIPHNAIQILIRERAIGQVRLDDYRRPVTAGYIIVNSLNRPCSIGYTGRDWVGNDGFFSASHCSTHIAQVDLSSMGQHVSQFVIGYETQDPVGWDCDGSGPGTTRCRYSDAAFWVRTSGVTSDFGKIARTTHWYGSDLIDVNNPRFTIVGDEDTTLGLTIDKMGYNGGWEYGQVTGTCVWIGIGAASGTMQAYCMGMANYYAEGGDSGGPTFWWDYPTQNVKALGMHSGADVYGNRFYSKMVY